MKKVQLSIVSLIACSNLLVAGGDIVELTPYEVEDIRAAEVISVVPVVPPVETAVVVNVPPPAVVVEPVADISSVYVGLGLAAARYDSSCGVPRVGCDGVDKTGGVLVRAGYDFNEYIGAEVRGLATTYKSNGGKIKHIGAFVKPMYPVTDALNVYGLGGYAKTTTEGSLRKTDVQGLALGAGIEYDFSEDNKKDEKYNREFDGQGDQEKGFGVFADYERLYQKSNAPELDAVSVGVTYDF
ncbi:MAG: Unknown protein [uncultured Sulfurovum sp.]|uniref:Outer membrane protein beta-barrel domain-containing protein n=1 Tax=uncultured Sulfurovum sp. TaxID=269237 RepID=A0A6S6TS05_9BACT|nr:MAG: Unknown protein [uncultured Sulfurovum sp.]